MSSVAGVCGGGSVGAAVNAALQFLAVSQCLIAEEWPTQSTVHENDSFDFIIVGGGTAGSILAARLAEVPHITVLLIEAGGDPPQESIIPGFRDVMKGSPQDWNFTTVNDNFSSQAFQNGRQKQPRGKMLGGSGSLSDMVYSRGNPADYEEWAEIAGKEWNWENVLQYFKKTEHMTDEKIINDVELMAFHRQGGEIEVAGSYISTYSTNKFLEAFEELGFDIVNDMTDPTRIGAGRFSHTIRNGRRDSAATGLLNKSASKNKNLYVLKNTYVTKILLDNNITYGVQILRNNRETFYYAKKEVIVSAGTFNTAKLLLLSGLGPRTHLEELGIKVWQDLPVGENLHDHVMVNTFLAVEDGTCVSNTTQQYMDVIQYLYDNTGPLSYSDSMGAYISLNESYSTIPDFSIYPTCLKAMTGFYDGCMSVLGFKPEICMKLNTENIHNELLSLAIVLLKPKSRGRVRLSSIDPLDNLLIYSGTFSDITDLDDFPEVITTAWSIAGTKYFKSKNARVIDLGLDECRSKRGMEALKCMALSTATSAWHAVGTAAMGTVVDDRLMVKGLMNLRVVDASVMPKVTRGNTHAPVVMIAEKAADFIKQLYGYVTF